MDPIIESADSNAGSFEVMLVIPQLLPTGDESHCAGFVSFLHWNDVFVQPTASQVVFLSYYSSWTSTYALARVKWL